MKKTISKSKVTLLSACVLLLGISLAYFIDELLLGSLLALGVALSLRQLLLKCIFDGLVSLTIFGLFFLALRFNFFWNVQVSLPYLIGALALYLSIREALVIRGERKAQGKSPP